MLTELGYYFSFPFVRYALIVGVLIALCSALLGVVLVLKRYSFIGDGLSHVAFGAIAIASVLKVTSNLVVVFPVTILAAVILLNSGQGRKIHGDAAIGMLSVSALAIGYLLMNLFPVSTNISGDVCTTLFGSTSILTLSSFDVWLCLFMSIFVMIWFVLCYHRIFAVTFDENFARATGIRTKRYNQLIAIITAVIIVLAMNLVGSLLVTALIIFPALSSMRIFHSFRAVIVSAAAIAILSSTGGILISILCATPVGATIVVFDLGIFAMCTIAGRLMA